VAILGLQAVLGFHRCIHRSLYLATSLLFTGGDSLSQRLKFRRRRQCMQTVGREPKTNYRIVIKVTSVTILKYLLKHFNPSTVRPSVPPAPVRLSAYTADAATLLRHCGSILGLQRQQTQLLLSLMSLTSLSTSSYLTTNKPGS